MEVLHRVVLLVASRACVNIVGEKFWQSRKEKPVNDALRPQNLTADRQAETLEIIWNDGHRSVYPFAGLRAVCPCVECRGSHEAMSQPIPRALLHTQPVASWQLENAFLIGHYALGLAWADGHDSGIYTWPLLRGLCPCADCDQALAATPGATAT